MAKVVSDAADLPPWYARANAFRLVAKTDRRFADDLQFALDCGDRIGFERNASKFMPEVNCSIIAMAAAISLNPRCEEDLKDKNRLALRPFQHLRQQHGPVRKVGFDAENVAQPVFQANPSN